MEERMKNRNVNVFPQCSLKFHLVKVFYENVARLWGTPQETIKKNCEKKEIPQYYGFASLTFSV